MKKNKKKKFKIKKKNLILLIVLFIILVIMLFLVGYKVCTKYLFKDDDTNVIEPIKKEEIDLDNYDYFIRSNATDYEKSLFDELKKVLSNEVIVEDDYASIVTKLFISDLFTLSNKNNSSDITSSQYVYNDYQDTFEIMVKDTIYANVEINLDGNRVQSLPIVKNVEVTSTTRNNFSLDNNVIDKNAYYVTANIEYETDLGYPTTYKLVLVKNNDLLQVVKAGE